MTVSIAYLFNPLTIASCLGRSTSIFTNTAIIHAVSNAIEGNGFRAMFALALASYFSLYPVLLLPPLVLLYWDQTARRDTKGQSSLLVISINLLGSFFGCLGGLFWLSYFTTGRSWEFIASTYGFHLSVPDLTPNVGLWWYFLIEIFDSFRDFFLGVFWLHLAGYSGGLTLRLRTQPLFVITTLLGIFAIFKPYPSISDISLYLGFVPLYKHVFPRKSLRATHMVDEKSSSPISHTLHFPGDICNAVRQSPWPRILLSLDIRWLRERQFLLRDHIGMESRAFDVSRGHVVCSATRRMGS